MGIKFDVKSSEIHDFLAMMSNIKAVEKEEFGSGFYQECVDPVEVERGKALLTKLEGYRDKLDFYYMDSCTVITSFVRFYSLEGYDSIDEYLNMLEKLDEDIVREIITCGILRMDFGTKVTKELISEAKELSKDTRKVINLIKETRISGEEKWNLFSMVEEPQRYMREYVELMRAIRPIFDEEFSKYREEVDRCGKEMVANVEEYGVKYLEELIGLVGDVKMSENEMITLYISAIAAQDITVRLGGENIELVWGVKTEETLNKVKEIKKEKLNDRAMTFKVLGDKTRYEVLKLIAEEEYNSKEIAEKLGISSATVSYHINHLSGGKIVQYNKDNKGYNININKEWIEECIRELKKDLKIEE